MKYLRIQAGDGVDARGNDEDDESRLLFHGDDIGQLGRK